MVNESVIYPTLSINAWWKLRKKFNSSIPKEVTSGYVAAALDMTEDSAKKNIVVKLKLIGLIDENNRPTELAIQWRDDEVYPKVCKELIQKLYPSELIDAIDDPIENKIKVTKWFQNKARVGEAAAKMMTAFYVLLVEADPTKQTEGTVRTERTTKAVSEKNVTTKPKEKSQHNVQNTSKPAEQTASSITSHFKPAIHLDIQIHISPDTSIDQIDKIFESMAKHLSGFKM